MSPTPLSATGMAAASDDIHETKLDAGDEITRDLDQMLAHYDGNQGPEFQSQTSTATLEAERDVLGLHSPVRLRQHLSDNMLVHAQQGLQDAVAQLPVTQRQAYETAVAQAPRILELESPPSRFLRATGYNYWMAAESLCQYWNLRLEVFGPEGAYRPLTAFLEDPEATTQALTPAAVQVLRTGGLSVAATPDQFGRPILLVDRERRIICDDKEDEGTRAQAIFYILQVLSESELALEHGFVVLVAEADPDSAQSKIVPKTTFMRLINANAFPLQVRGFHLVAAQQKTRSSQFWKRLHFNLLQQHAHGLSLRFRFHVAPSTEQVLRDIGVYGLSPSHVPSRLGGVADYRAWCQQRQTMERERYARILRPGPEIPVSTGDTTDPPPEEEPDTQIMKRKMQNFTKWAQQHLQKHKRRQVELQVDRERAQRDTLQKRNDFLQAQLTCATYMAEQYEADKQEIIKLLGTLVTPLFHEALPHAATPEPVSESESKDLDALSSSSYSSSLAESLYTNYMQFIGRAATTGEWRFVTAPGLSAAQQEISLRLQLFLCDEQKKRFRSGLPDRAFSPQQRINDTSVTHAMQNSSSQVSDESTDVDSTDEDDSPSYGQKEGDQDLDRQLESLRAQVNQLQAQKDSTERHQSFLKSSMTFSDHLSKGYMEYKKDHEELVTNLYSSILNLSSSSLNSEQVRSVAGILADRVLVEYTSFDGDKFVNAAVVLAQSAQEESKDATSNRFDVLLQNPVAIEYLMSLCHHSLSDQSILLPQPVPASPQQQESSSDSEIQDEMSQLQQAEEKRKAEKKQRTSQHKQNRLKRKKLLQRL